MTLTASDPNPSVIINTSITINTLRIPGILGTLKTLSTLNTLSTFDTLLFQFILYHY